MFGASARRVLADDGDCKKISFSASAFTSLNDRKLGALLAVRFGAAHRRALTATDIHRGHRVRPALVEGRRCQSCNRG